MYVVLSCGELKPALGRSILVLFISGYHIDLVELGEPHDRSINLHRAEATEDSRLHV